MLGAQVEILRRISVTLAVFTFTLLGCAFGMQQMRAPKKISLFIAFLLAMGVLVSYLGLKALKGHPTLACFATFAPHGLILSCSLRRIYACARGWL